MTIQAEPVKRKPSRVKIRQARPGDLETYLDLQKDSWGEDMAVAQDRAETRFRVCLDGILMAEVNGKVVGTTTMICLTSYDVERPKSWAETTGAGSCSTHDPHGRIGFGVDLSARGARKLGAVDALLVACMGKTIQWGAEYTVLGGRMLRFSQWLANTGREPDEKTALEYLYSRRSNGNYLDPEVQMYDEIPGLHIMGLIPDYFDDPESCNYGVLLRWTNPVYRWRWIPGSRRLFAHVPPLLLRLENYREYRGALKTKPSG